MDNVIKWVVTPPKEKRQMIRADNKRINQFEQLGYRIIQDDTDFFLIERLKTRRNMICSSIDAAEQIIRAALHIDNKTLTKEVTPNQDIMEKAFILTGNIDYIEGSRNKRYQQIPKG